MCYIDDCIFIAAFIEELRQHVFYTLHLFDSVGLSVNPQKSFLEPSKEVEILGILWTSTFMTVTLAPHWREWFKVLGLQLLRGEFTLLDLGPFFGLAVPWTLQLNLPPSDINI